jgi:ribosomal-protein-alanine N-acetyltransferase
VLSVVIRDYEIKDFRDIMEIDFEAFAPRNPIYDVYIYVTFGSDLIVADNGNRVVGYIAVMNTSQEEAKIISFAVKKEYRGCGIGKMLLKHAIERCKMKGKRRILLEVKESNHVAQRLYKKMGFEIIDFIPHYYPDGENAYVMALDLTGR